MDISPLQEVRKGGREGQREGGMKFETKETWKVIKN